MIVRALMSLRKKNDNLFTYMLASLPHMRLSTFAIKQILQRSNL